MSFVRALGRAEPGNGLAAVSIAQHAHFRRRQIERLGPACLAEMAERVGRVDIEPLGFSLKANERLGQPLRVVDIVEAEAALDAEAVFVGGTVLALDIGDLAVADLVGELAADAAIGADSVDLAFSTA